MAAWATVGAGPLARIVWEMLEDGLFEVFGEFRAMFPIANDFIARRMSGEYFSTVNSAAWLISFLSQVKMVLLFGRLPHSKTAILSPAVFQLEQIVAGH